MSGYVSVKTTGLAEDSAVAKLARLVEEAQKNQSSVQRLIDKCAKYYTPGLLINLNPFVWLDYMLYQAFFSSMFFSVIWGLRLIPNL